MNLNSLIGQSCPKCSQGNIEPGPFRTSKGDFVFCSLGCGYSLSGEIDWSLFAPPVDKSQRVNGKEDIL
jgi:hypothetical protein